MLVVVSSKSTAYETFAHRWLKEHHLTLTSDLGGEVGGVTTYKQLQLLMKVAAPEVDVPGSNSCREGRERLFEDNNVGKDSESEIWDEPEAQTDERVSFGSVSLRWPFSRCRYLTRFELRGSDFKMSRILMTSKQTDHNQYNTIYTIQSNTTVLLWAYIRFLHNVPLLHFYNKKNSIYFYSDYFFVVT